MMYTVYKMAHLIILVGFQASTKSTYCKKLLEKYPAAVTVSRDLLPAASKTADCLAPVKAALATGKTVILDNTNLTVESRAPFIELAQKYDAVVDAIIMKTCIEDCQIRLLRRMWNHHGNIFLDGKGTGKATKDPHVFPPAVLFKARKDYVEPEFEEGFDNITIKTVRPIEWKGYTNKGLFLDIDGTIRATEHLEYKYPVCPDEVELLHPLKKMRAVLDKYIADGYKLIGVSNQSGIAKGILTVEDVDAAFEETRRQLGYNEEEFPILYCPHRSVPVSCYCRKPQSGMFIKACEEWNINPCESIMVGDMKTDETAAKRIGIKYIDVKKFWQ